MSMHAHHLRVSLPRHQWPGAEQSKMLRNDRFSNLSRSVEHTKDESCAYTITHAASSWTLHYTNPTPSAVTIDQTCRWEGPLEKATFTFVQNHDGEGTTKEVYMTTLDPSQARESNIIQTVTIITATGLAPAGSFPTGLGVVVGGAAGLFAAALAL